MINQEDLRKGEVGIQLFGNIDLVADTIQPGINFAPLFAQCPSFSICALNYLSLLNEFLFQGIGFDLAILPACLSQ